MHHPERRAEAPSRVADRLEDPVVDERKQQASDGRSAMAEVMGGREGAEDVRFVCAAARQGVERLELADDHVAVPAEALELSPRKQ